MSNRVVSEERVVAYSAEFVTDSASLAMAAARSCLIREGGRGQVGLQLSLPWNFLVCLGGVREGGRSRGQVCRVGHHHRSGRSRGQVCRVGHHHRSGRSRGQVCRVVTTTGAGAPAEVEA